HVEADHTIAHLDGALFGHSARGACRAARWIARRCLGRQRPAQCGPMLATRAYRFAAQASLVARVYGGYKLIQALGRVGLAGADGHYARHHRRSAEAAYRLATRLEGLPIKVCQFLRSRADILP